MPVSINQIARPGRPRKEVDPHVIRDALSSGRHISLTQLGRILGLHRNTVRAKMKELGVNASFDQISNDELDEIIRQYRMEHPDAGRGYTLGHIRSKYGLRIQRDRVVESMNRVDGLGQWMRKRVSRKKKRQVYGVPRPNALWHIDGHHKLIQWGIVIHGIADGYSRKVECIV